ncbi:hypothetical protein PMI40_04606 [Herbaspirillum sp. YR522]|nr:hypothetical protein PMI40_04606 [Herbaspirillum sp. YR522]
MHFEIAENSKVDESKPLIYAWDIIDRETGELKGRYVGKAMGGSGRPRKQYRRNVVRMLAGKRYRLAKPDAFRAIHVALGAAVTAGDRIVLSFLCNVADGEDINKIERSYIQSHAPTLNRI